MIDFSAGLRPERHWQRCERSGLYRTIGAQVRSAMAVVGRARQRHRQQPLGPRTVVHPFASLAVVAASVIAVDQRTLEIGADRDIREDVTMNTGTEDGGGKTQVGEGCFFMVGSDVGHDCHVGKRWCLRRTRCSAGMSRSATTFLRWWRCGASVRSHRRECDDRWAERRARRRNPLWNGARIACNLVGLNVVGMRRAWFRNRTFVGSARHTKLYFSVTASSVRA